MDPNTEFMIQPIMQRMMDDGQSFVGCEIRNGTYHDTGNKIDYLKTVVEFALKHQDLGPEFRNFLRNLDLGE